MGPSKSLLDLLAFEVRYPYGHLYWDRCGQSILDIETQCDGWFSAKLENQVGRLENPEKGLVATFNENQFNLSARKLRESDLDLFTEEVQRIWKIIRSNFGLDDYDRIGLRFHYLIPTKSIEEAESLIKKSELNVMVPDRLLHPKYELTTRHITSIFKKEEMEFRVELKAIIRAEGIDPSSLLTVRPHTMPRRQMEYRLQKMKQLSDYSANPMYATMLDVDCCSFHINHIKIKEFITEQVSIIKSDFLPILEDLCLQK